MGLANTNRDKCKAHFICAGKILKYYSEKEKS